LYVNFLRDEESICRECLLYRVMFVNYVFLYIVYREGEFLLYFVSVNLQKMDTIDNTHFYKLFTKEKRTPIARMRTWCPNRETMQEDMELLKNMLAA